MTTWSRRKRLAPDGNTEISDIVITDDRCGIADIDDGEQAMVNKQKAVKRDLTRLRKTQNPQQADLRRERRLRKAKTEFWATKKGTVVAPSGAPKEKESRPRTEKAEEPEPEEIEEETNEQEEES